MKHFALWFCLFWLLPALAAVAFSSPKNNDNNNNSENLQKSPAVEDIISTSISSNEDAAPATLSRRDLLWKAPLGVVGAYAYGRLSFYALSVLQRGIEYPEPHEKRVESTIATALVAAAVAAVSSQQQQQQQPLQQRPLRVLEVGIGTDCRLIRRGLYDTALHQLSSSSPSSMMSTVELVGLDLRLPTDQNVIKDTQRKLDELSRQTGLVVNFRMDEGSVSTKEQQQQQQQRYADGYFDSILCCLTLCSVEDQTAALQEIKRLLRPDGGTFGYIEHVAVDDNDDQHRFLELQQKVLDPLQQKLADNCHLHRYTEGAIASIFDLNDGTMARYLQQERFYVNNMWPVSCQCCGVVQRI